MIYHGNVAKEILLKNLNDRNYNRCQGYFFDNNFWVAFDNKRGDCFIEEFETEEKAICWLEQLFEISELNHFKVSRLLANLFLIPKIGLLKIHFKKEVVSTKFYPFWV